MTESPVPQESVDAILEQMQNPFYLPTTAQLETVFGTFPNRYATNETAGALMEINGGYLCEYPTQEYVRDLSGYLGRRIDELGGTVENPVPILEVAAGLGRMAYFVTQQLDRDEATRSKYTYIATDNFSDTSTVEADVQYLGMPVHPTDYEHALEIYKPTIVIGSWLPSRKTGARRTDIHDWTTDFRRTPTVQEYILIGIPGRHATLESFGLEYDDGPGLRLKTIPQHETQFGQDGFVMQDLGFSHHQISMESFKGHLHTSKTVSFRRTRLPQRALFAQ